MMVSRPPSPSWSFHHFLFVHSFAALQSHRLSNSSACHTDRWRVWHKLVKTGHIVLFQPATFFLFFISPFCCIFFGVIPLCQIPPLMSRGVFYLQMTDVNGSYEMGGSTPLTDFLVVSSSEPQICVCFEIHGCFFELKLHRAAHINSSLRGKLLIISAAKGYMSFCWHNAPQCIDGENKEWLHLCQRINSI